MSTEFHAATAPSATAGNDRLAEAVLAALRADSRLDSIRVTDVSVSPIRDRDNRLVGYAAATNIDFLTHDLDSIAVLLTRTIAAGATSVGQVAFESDSAGPAHDRALALALAQAEREARALATASGHRLGPMLAMTSSNPWLGRVSGFVDAVIDRPTDPLDLSQPPGPLVRVGPTPRDIEVTAAVTARWQLSAP